MKTTCVIVCVEKGVRRVVDTLVSLSIYIYRERERKQHLTWNKPKVVLLGTVCRQLRGSARAVDTSVPASRRMTPQYYGETFTLPT